MLSKSVCKSAKAAISYFDDGLSIQDYYSEKGEVRGRWNGKLAEKMQLEKEVSRDDFVAICKNRFPGSEDKKITVRDSASRRVFTDFTISVSKSVSVVHAITGDERILEAVQKANQVMLAELEKLAAVQTGRGKNKGTQTTGNMLAASFLHTRARPVRQKSGKDKGDYIPDPQGHIHNAVMNMTYNEKKNRYEAMDYRPIVDHAKYLEAVFHNELAYLLQKVGYTIERTRDNFEIKGIAKETLDKFSNRRKEILDKVKEWGITSHEGRQAVVLALREGKKKGENLDQTLKQSWNARLDADEKKAIHSTNSDKPIQQKELSAEACIDYALEHHLSRKSTVGEHELLQTAIKRGTGSVRVDAVKEALLVKREELLSATSISGTTLYTTQSALAEEQKLVQSSRKSKGMFSPVNADYQIKNEQLSDEQQAAVQHALSSKDFITVISGRAGTGKTWSIKEVAEGAKDAGIGFMAIAPTTKARDIQKEDGFESSTVAKLLTDKKLQNQIKKDAVIWVDEGGLVGNRTMNQLIDLAKEKQARILISGDVTQHSSVERGDALRIMQTYGGIQPAYITKIFRQQKAGYLKATKLISKGEIEKGFAQLDKMNAIHEHEDYSTLLSAAAKDYAAHFGKKSGVELVAPTHVQGKHITDAIREELKSLGKIKGQEVAFTINKASSLTEAEKKDVTNYAAGMSIKFDQHLKGIKRGSIWDVQGKDKYGNVLLQHSQNEKLTATLPLDKSNRFSVYEKKKRDFAVGDKIRMTSNGTSYDGKRLNNGDELTIQKFGKDGSIYATTGKRDLKLKKDHRLFEHGYYSTSIKAQGKTASKVILLQTTLTGKAASKQQFYVSTTRGKTDIAIYTDDKSSMLRSVQRSADRMTATELAGKQKNDVGMIKAKFQKLGSIYKASTSKISDAWNQTKNMLQLSSQPVKPVKHVAPIRTK